MQEVWKAVQGYNGAYEVSTQGNVRSTDRFVNVWFGTRLIKGRQLLDWILPCGYKCVALCNHSKKNTLYIHRLVAFEFVDGYSDGLVVNHKDGDKLNNLVENLEWVTYSGNANHAFRTGLKVSQKGEAASAAKLKESEVLKIRDLLKHGAAHIDIAQMFNISYSVVSAIKTRRTWRHI